MSAVAQVAIYTPPVSRTATYNTEYIYNVGRVSGPSRQRLARKLSFRIQIYYRGFVLSAGNRKLFISHF